MCLLQLPELATIPSTPKPATRSFLLHRTLRKFKSRIHCTRITPQQAGLPPLPLCICLLSRQREREGGGGGGGGWVGGPDQAAVNAREGTYIYLKKKKTTTKAETFHIFEVTALLQLSLIVDLKHTMMHGRLVSRFLHLTVNDKICYDRSFWFVFCLVWFVWRGFFFFFFWGGGGGLLYLNSIQTKYTVPTWLIKRKVFTNPWMQETRSTGNNHHCTVLAHCAETTLTHHILCF